MGRARRPRLVTWVFARVMLANLGYFFSIGAINPVLPRFIEGPLGGSDIGVGIGVGAFTVTALLMRPWSGTFGDRHGRQLPLLLGASIHTVSLAGMVAATSLVHVVALRLVTGVGEALFFVAAATAIQDMAPDDRRGEAASLFSLSLFAGIGAGPVVGEVLLDRWGFDAVWWVAAGTALFGALVAVSVPDTRPDKTAPDARVRLVHPAALRPGLVLACAIWGLAAFNAFVPLYALQVGLDGSRLVFLTNAAVIFLVRSVGARIPDQLGPLRTSRLSLVCTPAGLGVMALWSEAPGLFTGAVLLGVGQALAFPALMTIAINNAPGSERGSVMGTFTAFFDLSFGVGAVTLGAVAHVTGYSGAFLAAMGMASLGFAMLVLAPPPIRRPAARTITVLPIDPPGE